MTRISYSKISQSKNDVTKMCILPLPAALIGVEMQRNSDKLHNFDSELFKGLEILSLTPKTTLTSIFRSLAN